MDGFDYFNWIILPVLIFLSRLADVTLNTLRHVFISKGYRYRSIVPLLGFFEVLIWLIAISQVMKNLNNVACYLGWAAGFASGSYLGLIIEERMALGMQVIRVITNQNCDELIEALRKDHHGVTIVPAQGAMGPVKMLFTVIKRKNVDAVIKLIQHHLPEAFYSLEDIKEINKGVFHHGPKTTLLKRIVTARK